jgi:hypothetical protein
MLLILSIPSLLIKDGSVKQSKVRRAMATVKV